MRYGWLATWICLGVLGCSRAGEAAERMPLDVDDLFASRFQEHGVAAATSPDGEWIASAITDPEKIHGDTAHVGFASDSGRGSVADIGTDIWLFAARSAQRRNLTAGVGNNWAPTWSPDGQKLAFLSDRDGVTRLWVWLRRSNSVHKVSAANVLAFFGYETPIWTPDGRSLLVRLQASAAPAAAGGTRSDDYASSPPGLKVQMSSLQDVGTAVEVHGRCDIAAVDIESGDVTLYAKDVRGAANYMRLSPDGRHLAFTEPERVTSHGVVYSLSTVELGSHARQTLVREMPVGMDIGAFTWAPDSRYVAYVAGDILSRHDPVQGTRDWNLPSELFGTLHVVSVEDGGETSFVTPGNRGFSTAEHYVPLWDRTATLIYLIRGNELWRASLRDKSISLLATHDAGPLARLLPTYGGNEILLDRRGSILAVAQETESRTHALVRFEPSSGTESMVVRWIGRVGIRWTHPVMAPNGEYLVYVAESSDVPPDLWLLETQSMQARRITHLAPQLDKYVFATNRVIAYRDYRGGVRHSNLLLPVGYDKARRYPMIVWVYPGDAGSDSAGRFDASGSGSYNLQMLTTRGYAVLVPDIPIYEGTVMEDIVGSVMPAVEQAVDLGIADDNRLGVMGQSGGAYAVLSILVQTPRFKAAVANSGIGFNPLARIDFSDVMQIGRAPWSAPQRFVANTPLFFLDRIQTPLLIQAGSEDAGSAEQSRELLRCLRQLGKKAIYLEYAGESHVLEAPGNVADYWNRVLDFFDHNVKQAVTGPAADP